MATTKRTKSKHQSPFSAPDVLGRSQNWVQKVSSIRLSNIRVGQHFTDVGQHLTNMLTDKDSVSHAVATTPQKSDIFHPSFCKLLKIKQDGISLIFVGGKSGVRIWRTQCHNNSESSTDLIYTSGENNMNCVDLCFSEQHTDPTSSAGKVDVFLLLAHGSDSTLNKSDGIRGHIIRPLLVSGDFSAPTTSPHFPQVSPGVPHGDQQYEYGGTANSIACTNRFLLVSQTSTGTLQLLSQLTMRRVGELPSLGPHRPVVLATSPRWIAIQTSQESVVGTKSGQLGHQRHAAKKRPGSGATSVPDMGEAARQVVSGLYSLSQVVSWQVVSPLISAAVQSKGGKGGRELGGEESREGEAEESRVVGGGVLVMDLGQTAVELSPEEGTRNDQSVDVDVDVAVRAHFAAHSSELGCMSFSSAGLKLASADCFGQVVLVHSLVPSGLLSKALPVISPASLHNGGGDGPESESMGLSAAPQLLFKLVRGLSLSSIVQIGFSANESVVFASTANGTVHVFDLDQLSATDSSQGHSHGSSLASHSSFKSGNSLTNGGFGSLDHSSLLLSPPTSSGLGPGPVSGSAGGNSSSNTLLTMAAGAVSEGAFHQYGIPSADVSQFLSLSHPDLRVLQGYSDLRVKLPLSETFYRQQQLQQQGNGDGKRVGLDHHQGEEPRREDLLRGDGNHHENGGAGGTSFYPQEVNLHSSSLLYGVGGQTSENRGSFELLVGTSEGLLSRFHLTLSASSAIVQQNGGGGGNSGVPSVLSNLLPYSQSQSIKELNRWDLCASAASESGNGASNGTSNGSSGQHLSQSQSQSHGASAQVGKAGEGDFSAWLYAASDVDEPLVTPLWIRPQVKLFTFAGGGADLVSRGVDLTEEEDDKAVNKPVDVWIDKEAKVDGGGQEFSSIKKKKKKSKTQQQSQQPSVTNDDDVAFPSTHSNGSTTIESTSSVESSRSGDVVSIPLLFPERQPSTLLNISRPSTFVYGSSSGAQGTNGGSGSDALQLDTGEMLEQYIQTALGESFSDSHRGATPIAISMIKHARPPEDISAWHMDDDWGNEEEEEAGIE